MNMDALKQLADFLNTLFGYALVALAAMAGLSLLYNLATPAIEVGKGLAALGNTVMVSSGPTCLIALVVLALVAHVSKKA